MLTLYFSGTGNSRFIAEMFAAEMGGECLSIEAEQDFGYLIQGAETIAFVYPVYSSRVPRIMREFVKAHRADLYYKQLIVLCTQLGFSGDGARCFTDLLPKGTFTVLYAEHFLMPNNINNTWVFKRTSEKRIQQLVETAGQRMVRVCTDLKAGTVRKRGFNLFSRIMGLPQGLFMPLLERAMENSVRISDECTGCGLCMNSCPMKNLSLVHGKAAALGNCTECYRCINLCPERAIIIYFKTKANWQYQGINDGR